MEPEAHPKKEYGSKIPTMLVTRIVGPTTSIDNANNAGPFTSLLSSELVFVDSFALLSKLLRSSRDGCDTRYCQSEVSQSRMARNELEESVRNYRMGR